MTNELTAQRRYTNSQLQLIHDTVAKGTSDDELKLFMETAARYDLSPFKRQIHAVVFNADKPDRRQMAIVVGINGYRTLGYRAAKEGGFQVLPDPSPPVYSYDEEQKSATNPLGLVSVSVSLKVRYNPTDEWSDVTSTVYWDERAPIRPGKGGESYLERGAWHKQPRHMLAKCCEADCWRKVAPDLAAIYEESEVQHAMIDITDQVENLDVEKRKQQAGVDEPGVLVQWQMNLPLERVPYGVFADRCFAHIAAATDHDDLMGWYDTNNQAFKEFWAVNKADALEVKKAYEDRLTSFVVDDEHEVQEALDV